MAKIIALPSYNYGVFTSANTVDSNGFIGVTETNESIIIFLWNSQTKKCLAIHERLSFESNINDQQSIVNYINDLIQEFSKEDVSKNNYGAALCVSSTVVEHISKIISAIDQLGIGMKIVRIDDISSEADSADILVFNVMSGDIGSGKKNDFASIDPRPPKIVEAASNCRQYFIANRSSMTKVIDSLISESFREMAANPEISEQSKNFADEFQSYFGDARLINFWEVDKFTAEVRKYIDDLANKCGHIDPETKKFIEAEPTAVIKMLCTNRYNPISFTDAEREYTPLHRACKQFLHKKNKPDTNYKYKAIIVMLLLLGRRDLQNNVGETALSYIDSIDEKFSKTCKEYLRILKDFDNLDENTQDQILQFAYGSILKIKEQIFLYEKSNHTNDKDKKKALDGLHEFFLLVLQRIPDYLLYLNLSTSVATTPQYYIHMHWQNAGIFTKANTKKSAGLIGATIQKEQTIYLIWNSEDKTCLAICCDKFVSVQALQEYIDNFIGNVTDIRKYALYYFSTQKRYINDQITPFITCLRKWLSLDVNKHIKVEHRSFHRKENPISTVIFNLESGDAMPQACIVAYKAIEPRDPKETILVDAYMQDRIEGILTLLGAKECYKEEDKDFIDFVEKTIISGVPLMPLWDIRSIVDQQLYKLACHIGYKVDGAAAENAVEPNAIEIAKLLLFGFVNPMTCMNHLVKNRSPMDYACYYLKKNEDAFWSYKLKAIIVLFLLRGLSSSPYESETTALDHLSNITDVYFTKACNNFIAALNYTQKPLISDIKDAALLKTIQVIKDLFVYEKLAYGNKDQNTNEYKNLNERLILAIDHVTQIIAASSGVNIEASRDRLPTGNSDMLITFDEKSKHNKSKIVVDDDDASLNDALLELLRDNRTNKNKTPVL